MESLKREMGGDGGGGVGGGFIALICPKLYLSFKPFKILTPLIKTGEVQQFE